MLLWALAAAALFFASRWIVGRALGYRTLWPRQGALWRRGLVALSCPLVPIPSCALGTFAVGLIAGTRVEGSGAIVSGVAPGSPAEQSGLQAGDAILRVDGAAVRAVEEVAPAVRAAQGRAVALEIERAGRERRLSVAPRDGRIGVQLAPPARQVRDGRRAAREALRLPFKTWAASIGGYSKLLRGSASVELAGPVGIVESLGREPDPWLWRLLRLILSLALPAMGIGTLVGLGLLGSLRRQGHSP